MLSPELQQAISGLRIDDIYLEKVSAEVFDRGLDIKSSNCNIAYKFGVGSFEVMDKEDRKVVCFRFDAGLRWTTKATNESSTKEKAEKGRRLLAHVEGELVAWYAMKEPLSEEILREFALKNCGIHVWPYWREFVTSTCDRLRIPRVTLPIVQFQTVEHEQDEG